jgi:hypothetical protein
MWIAVVEWSLMTNPRGTRRAPTLVCIFLTALLAAPFSIDGRVDAGRPAAGTRPLWTFDTGG